MTDRWEHSQRYATSADVPPEINNSTAQQMPNRAMGKHVKCPCCKTDIEKKSRYEQGGILDDSLEEPCDICKNCPLGYLLGGAETRR